MLNGHFAHHLEKCWAYNGDQSKYGFFLHGAHDLEVGKWEVKDMNMSSTCLTRTGKGYDGVYGKD